MKQYLVILKHDNGETRMLVTSTSEEQAILLVMAAEHCPKCAISSIKDITDNSRKYILL
jgi:hypothetical protein